MASGGASPSQIIREMHGENEGCICNKSCDNTYRFNTFGEGSTELSVRHGNRCDIYANFFIGCEGIRFFGHDHRIYSDYFPPAIRPSKLATAMALFRRRSSLPTTSPWASKSSLTRS